jgi:hypothetical protein
VDVRAFGRSSNRRSTRIVAIPPAAPPMTATMLPKKRLKRNQITMMMRSRLRTGGWSQTRIR